MIYESPREAMERESAPHFRNFDEEDADDYQTNSMRSRRREKYNNGTYDKHVVPPSLAEQIRQTSSRKSQSEYESHAGDAASKCIQNNFDITSAKSIAFSLVNPCGLSPSDVVNPLPTTPSTACGSFSDDSETSQSLCSPRDVQATLLQRGSGKSKGDNGLESRRTFLQAHTTNVNAEDGDIVIFVGSQEYRFPCSGGSLNFASKYFLRRREEAKHFSFVDLSTHSPEEFKIVMKFFENNPARDAWSHIHWKNLPVILPWFVEFQALPLMSAVDTFLLQNAFSAAGDRYRADNSNSNKYRHISLSSLLSLMEIAFACGLESTKLHARRLLRRCLLEPRKQSTNPDLDSSRDSEQAAEDIELEWTLQDLQVLAKLLKNHADLREYLWEVAVIIYLPHDLDISDSIGLVSNTLFPYLLREGMMQMMIVEGIESSFQTTDNSFLTESSVTSSILGNSKALGSSFSEQTSCSDATIPTTPSSQLKYLTEKDVHQYLKKVIKQLEKFKAEKEARTTMQQDQPHNSLVVDEPSDDLHARPRRLYASAENRSSTRSRDSRGVTTFAC